MPLRQRTRAGTLAHAMDKFCAFFSGFMAKEREANEALKRI